MKAAVISGCGRYRYRLERQTDLAADSPTKRICWVMLNPSVGNAEIDDPTIRRVIGFSKLWGFTDIVIVNIFAWRATDPKVMKIIALRDINEARGPENWDYVRNAVSIADEVVCAWGPNGTVAGGAFMMRNLLKGIRYAYKCLGKAKNGQPRHPLMVPYSKQLEDFIL